MNRKRETALVVAAVLGAALNVPAATAEESLFIYRGKAGVIVTGSTPPVVVDPGTPNPSTPPPTAPTISFADGNAPAAVRHKAWSFNASTLLRTANVPDGESVAWSLADAPAWVSLGRDGVLSGLPGAQDRTASARVSAAVAGVTASKVFEIEIGGVAWSVSSISAGRTHTCAVTSAGGVICWGTNTGGSLGDGTTSQSSVPVEVLAPAGQSGFLRGVKEVSAGNNQACALTSVGRVLCWGNNGSGQLGDGTTSSRSRPTPVLSVGSGSGPLTGVATLSVGMNSSACATLNNGNAVCWGHNANGQLGNQGTASSSRPVYVSTTVGTMPGLVSISTGWFHACAVREAADVYCWGYGLQGQRGTGQFASSSVPQYVVSVGNHGSRLSDVKQVAAGKEHTCALHSNGRVACWGSGSLGQLGENQTRNTNYPVAVAGVTNGTGAAINNDQISVGEDFTCARFINGFGMCWGANGQGQLGVWDTANRSYPHYVRSMGSESNLLTRVTSVSAGAQHACVTYADGKAACFGNGGSGRLGVGSATSTDRARDVVLD